MSKIAAAFAREPVMLGELVKSGLTLAIAFGAKLTLEQLAALYGFVSIAGAFVVRAFVSPGGKSPPSSGSSMDQISPPPAPPPKSSGPPKPAALVAMLAVACMSCSSTPADRVRYGIAAVEMACEVAEKHPADVPPDVKERLDPICLELAAGSRE